MKFRPGNFTRGMTLVEVVLSLGLFVMLGLFVVAVMRSVIGLWAASERHGRGDLEFLAAAERFRADIAALHNGPRGWLALDTWEIAPGDADSEPWIAPRLRFLARGDALRGDDQTGLGAVEVMWTLAPETSNGVRLHQWLRFVQPEGSGSSLTSDRYAVSMARAQSGTAVLDGVGEWFITALEATGDRKDFVDVAPDSLGDFPLSFSMTMDRVEGGARLRPPVTDSEIGPSTSRLEVRGSAPMGDVSYVLLGKEWVKVSGAFPRWTLNERAARGTQPLSHARGTEVLIPRTWTQQLSLPAFGRRIQPW
ncbi:MAG: hypothetical protein MK213_07690 [Planctomycetes bacterium]|nr:hypothetical protein [Planctomycetota bacterium]